jgi:hypothetical protein
MSGFGLPLVVVAAWLVGAVTWAARRRPAIDRACQRVAPAVWAAIVATVLCWLAYRFAAECDPTSDLDPDSFGPSPGFIIASVIAAMVVPFLWPITRPIDESSHAKLP